MITSARNPRIQWVRSLQSRSRDRREEGAFVVEGVRLVEDALAAGWDFRLALYTDDLNERGRSLVAALAARGIPVEQVTPQVMRAASDTETPQGILAVLPLPGLAMPEQLDFLFIPDAVRDPGNLGSMLRTASAAGVQAVVLSPGAVDAFAPKVVRAGMGAHFRLPLLSLGWEEIRAHIRRAGLRVFLASAGQGTVCWQADFQRPLALIVGGEAEGAGSEAQALADEQVQIPMPGRLESLNAAAAAAILLFDVLRQRSKQQ
jgi:TrmH family RNA methyltransferase